MKKLILLLLFIPLCTFGKEESFSDGPYIFIEKNTLIEKKIINSDVLSTNLKTSLFDTFYVSEKPTFNNIGKIAALSDIHGQYDLLIELLKNNKIIDKNLN
jgi:hypothetical protein